MNQYVGLQQDLYLEESKMEKNALKRKLRTIFETSFFKNDDPACKEMLDIAFVNNDQFNITREIDSWVLNAGRAHLLIANKDLNQVRKLVAKLQ